MRISGRPNIEPKLINCLCNHPKKKLFRRRADIFRRTGRKQSSLTSCTKRRSSSNIRRILPRVPSIFLSRVVVSIPSCHIPFRPTITRIFSASSLISTALFESDQDLLCSRALLPLDRSGSFFFFFFDTFVFLRVFGFNPVSLFLCSFCVSGLSFRFSLYVCVCLWYVGGTEMGMGRFSCFFRVLGGNVGEGWSGLIWLRDLRSRGSSSS